MPPKIKIKREEIVSCALELIRLKGEQGMNARAIAEHLKCSTQPIFSNFQSMEDLRSAVLAAAYDLYLIFIQKEIASELYPKYKAMGMAYIRFANVERELFKLLFMRDRTGEDISPSPDFEESVQIIMETNGFSHEQAMFLHLEMWACVHGIATMLATSFLELDFEIISQMLTDTYQGIRTRYISEEN